MRLELMFITALLAFASLNGSTLTIAQIGDISPRKFAVSEWSVRGFPPVDNPFDPGSVAVDAYFLSDSGESLVVPAFWVGSDFRVRFTPPSSGRWKVQVRARGPGIDLLTEWLSFRAGNSGLDGFVRVSTSNARYFHLDSGKSYVPIGLNLCWPDAAGVSSYARRFAKLRTVGGNFARIWTTQERRLETDKVGLGRYDLKSAEFYDQVFQEADQNDIRTMLTFDDYRVLAKTDYFNAHWDSSPYNAAKGGPLTEPTDFFGNKLCQRLYRQRLRYLVARYSAYPSLGIWELYNEQDNIPKPGVPTQWFREMTEYLASIDPYHHPITTSYSWDDKAEVWQSPALSVTQRHLYGQGDTVDFVSMIVQNSQKLAKFGKPRLIGEFGITWKEPDIALDKAKLGTPLHDALWASIMTGDAGGAMTWWWDNYLEPLNLWGIFVGISQFVHSIDFSHSKFEPFSVELPNLKALGLQDPSSCDSLLWVHDPRSNWKDDAARFALSEHANVTVSIRATHPMLVQIWDTRSGKVIRQTKVAPKNGSILVQFPPFLRDIAAKVTSAENAKDPT